MVQFGDCDRVLSQNGPEVRVRSRGASGGRTRLQSGISNFFNNEAWRRRPSRGMDTGGGGLNRRLIMFDSISFYTYV